MADHTGRVFGGKYRATRLLGEGGMGAVFEAEHTVIHRKVALKVMHAELSASQEIIQRFLREAQASSAIGHPNIVDIEDIGQEPDGSVYIVMEILSGRTLKELLEERGALEPVVAVGIALQVLSALAAAHAKGIIHRDMKPDNVFLAVDARGREEVKILDFGIAKFQTGHEEDQGLTKTGTILGTPYYMSPEQARGKKIDHRIDIWAVGVMLYEMLTGVLPFQGESYNEVLGEILLERPPALSGVVPGLPVELVRVVERAMAKDPEDRFGSVTEMAADLLPLEGGAVDRLSEQAAVALRSSVALPFPDSRAETRPRGEPISAIAATEARAAVTIAEPRAARARLDTRSGAFRAVIAVALIGTLLLLTVGGLDSLYNRAVAWSEQAVLFWHETADRIAGRPKEPAGPLRSLRAAPRAILHSAPPSPLPAVDAGVKEPAAIAPAPPALEPHEATKIKRSVRPQAKAKKRRRH